MCQEWSQQQKDGLISDLLNKESNFDGYSPSGEPRYYQTGDDNPITEFMKPLTECKGSSDCISTQSSLISPLDDGKERVNPDPVNFDYWMLLVAIPAFIFWKKRRSSFAQ